MSGTEFVTVKMAEVLILEIFSLKLYRLIELSFANYWRQISKIFLNFVQSFLKLFQYFPAIFRNEITGFRHPWFKKWSYSPN